jgi:hypothetical protein
MPAFLSQAGAMIAGVAMSMAAQLMTERFLKRLVVQALQLVVNKTETPEDNKVLDEAKRAWNVE